MSKRFLSLFFIVSFVVLFIGGSRLIFAGEREYAACLSNNAHSSGMYKKPGFFEHEHLLNFEQREALKSNGLSLELVFTAEFLTIHSGGLKKSGSGVDTSTSYLGNIDFTAELDTEKAGLWKGGTLFLYLLNNHGANPSRFYIGDLQTASNIETKESTRLYELWYEHIFDIYDTDLSMLIGQHDLNSEFNVTEYGSLFTNSSFGIQPDISANVPVSIFSVAAPAFRLKWEPTDSLYFMAAVYDGDPGTPEENRSGMRWSLSNEEGFMYIYEMGYHFGDPEDSKTFPGSYKLGYWRHTAEFDDVRDTDANENPLEHHKNYGVYFLFDQMLIPGEGKKGLGAFFQIGGVPEDRNEVDFYVGGGIHYQGIIPSRKDDVLGLAVAHASISGDLRDAEDVAEPDGSTFHSRDKHETAIELTYKTQITPWLTIQPGVQTVINPGADSSLDDAVISTLRFQINF
jgi:porin